MTGSAFGQRYPILLAEHHPEWAGAYRRERTLLEHAVGLPVIERIHHFGSTAVPGLLAKPTIDILIEIREDADTGALIQNVMDAGYLVSHHPENPPPHLLFKRGYAPNGFEGQAYHVHIRFRGDWDELYFRDYLLDHPAAAAEYAMLKIALKEKYEQDREAYTEGKTAFIRARTAEARKIYGRKY